MHKSQRYLHFINFKYSSVTNDFDMLILVRLHKKFSIFVTRSNLFKQKCNIENVRCCITQMAGWRLSTVST